MLDTRSARDAIAGAGTATERLTKHERDNETGRNPATGNRETSSGRRLGTTAGSTSVQSAHELSDEDIADIANKIVSGHASRKHRKEFSEFGTPSINKQKEGAT